MTLISSRFTALTKWGLPIGWFGFFVLFFGAGIASASGSAGSILLGLSIAVAGFFAMRLLVADLADSVLDGGTFLQVARRGITADIPLQDIADVSIPKFSSPPRVSVRLLRPSPLGTDFSFLPQSAAGLNPFGRAALAHALLERVVAARAKNAA